MLKYVSTLFIVLGILFISFFSYQLFQSKQSQKDSLANAEELISSYEEKGQPFEVAINEAFATLEIPKLNKTLPIVEGTDADALDKGIGHLVDSVFPGEREQIVLSGHRDTVFRDFAQIEIGDQFIVNMPYGSFTYEIRETEIVSEDDTSVIRNMGEEVLVVTTCYPFRFVGNAPERFVTYAYPVN